MRTRSILLLLLSLFPALPASGGELPSELSRLLGRSGIANDSVSLEVRKIGEPVPMLSLNTKRPRNPGSVIKLVTTLAALELLGPNYTWQTEYYLDGTLQDGQLDGDLVLRGGGDPYLVIEQFWRHLQALRDRGLRTISGNLVLDNSALEIRDENRSRFDGQGERVYNVIPNASMINYSATRFLFLPQQGRLAILADPPASNLRIENRIALDDGSCNNNSRLWSYKTRQNKKQTVITFDGRYPAACGEYALTRAILSNADYTYGVFKEMWRQLGGTFDGGLRYGVAPPTTPFLSLPSRPLSDAIYGINKFSNNTMARLLLLTIGRELYGEPGNIDSGIQGIKEWLEKRVVRMPGLVLDNGAGLSRKSRATAHGLSNLLETGWSSSYRPEYLASLSIVATDGTMRRRLQEQELAGRIRIKTGLLNEARTMAGYVKSRNGDHYTVVLLLNGPKIGYENGNRVQDALLRWVVEH